MLLKLVKWHFPLVGLFIIILCDVEAKLEKKSKAQNGPQAQVVNIETLEDITHYPENTKQSNMCIKMNTILKKKDMATRKLLNLRKKLLQPQDSGDKGEGEREAKDKLATAQAQILDLFLKQLKLNEKFIYTTVDWLDQSIAGKYKEVATMKKLIKNRLKYFRDAALQEEQDHLKLLDAEKTINKTLHLHEKALGGMVGQILSEISHAADELEVGLGDHVFEDAKNKQLIGDVSNIETVVRLESKEETIPRLVDANDNQFVLSKSRDSTSPHEDVFLLVDLVYISGCTTIFSFLCSLAQLPAMFGQVVSGVILGPSLLGILNSLVQIETLAELGVFFIMFTVGLEFSPDHIKKVLVVACLASVGLMLVMVIGGLLAALLISGSSLTEAAFIAACFSLSSTPLVVKLTSNQSGRDIAGFKNLDYVDILLGILVLQDILMGLLIAFLPAFAGKNSILSSAGLLFHVIMGKIQQYLHTVFSRRGQNARRSQMNTLSLSKNIFSN